MAIELQQAGTYRQPGPIGRTVRFGFGALLLFFPLQIITKYGYGAIVRASDPSIWIGIAFSLWLIVEVVNVGFGRNFGQWPRYIALALIALGGISDVLLTGSIWGLNLSLALMALIAFVYGYLGASFVMAALFAVPG